MKTTRIKYKMLKNDNIQITDIQNVASLKELKEAFGEKIVTEYLYCQNKLKYLRLYEQISDFRVYEQITDQGDYLFVGQIINKKFFDNIVFRMRKAAERLIKIRKEQENKIYTVEI